MSPSASPDWPPVPLPSPTIEGDGFWLRPWSATDVDALVGAWADPEIRRWTNPPPPERDRAAQWIAGVAERSRRAMALDLVIETADEVVGEIGLSQFGVRAGTCAVGFWVAAAARGQGLAAEALRTTQRWGVETLGLDAMLATTAPDNVGSVVTLQRCGFDLLTTDERRGEVVHAWRATGRAGRGTPR